MNNYKLLNHTEHGHNLKTLKSIKRSHVLRVGKRYCGGNFAQNRVFMPSSVPQNIQRQTIGRQ